jgi:FixJ family two-component response regulator
VAAGESLLAPSVTRRLIEAYISQPEQATVTVPKGLDELSPRELEVLGPVARGSTNREIAEALCLPGRPRLPLKLDGERTSWRRDARSNSPSSGGVHRFEYARAD